MARRPSVRCRRNSHAGGSSGFMREICGPETESGRHSQGQDVPELRRDRPRPDSDMPAPSVAPLCSDMFGALPGVSSSSCFSGDRCPGAGAYVSVLPRSMRISSCVNTADVFHSLFIRLSLTGGKMRRGGVEFRPVPCVIVKYGHVIPVSGSFFPQHLFFGYVRMCSF